MYCTSFIVMAPIRSQNGEIFYTHTYRVFLIQHIPCTVDISFRTPTNKIHKLFPCQIFHTVTSLLQLLHVSISKEPSSGKHNTVLTVVKYVGCSQDTVSQDPSHLYNITKYSLHLNLLTLLNHVSCVAKMTDLVQTVLLWFDNSVPIFVLLTAVPHQSSSSPVL